MTAAAARVSIYHTITTLFGSPGNTTATSLLLLLWLLHCILSGLIRLTIQSFTFEDPGGWNTHAYFDLRPLKTCHKLRQLHLQLGTWECEHCEAFELPGLSDLSQLNSLKVAVGSRFIPQGQANAQVCQDASLALALCTSESIHA